MSRNTFSGSLGGQVQELQFVSHHQHMELDHANYPAVSAMKQAKVGCHLNGGKTCFSCPLPDCRLPDWKSIR